MFNQNRAGGAFGLGGNTQAGNTGFGGTPAFGAGGGLGQPSGMNSFGQPSANTFGQTNMGQSPGFGTTPGTQSGESHVELGRANLKERMCDTQFVLVHFSPRRSVRRWRRDDVVRAGHAYGVWPAGWRAGCC